MQSRLPQLTAWMQRHRLILLAVAVPSLLAGLLAVALLALPRPPAPAPPPARSLAALQRDRVDSELSYSALQRLIAARRIQAALLDTDQDQVTFYARGRELSALTVLPPATTAALADRLTRAGADVALARPTPPPPLLARVLGGPLYAWGSLLASALLPALLLAGLLAFLLYAWQGYRRPAAPADGTLQPAGAEASALRADVAVAEVPTTRFRDVAGCDEVIEELEEFVGFLRGREHYARVGAQLPSGVILHGPPGTGKTLLARALAGEAGVPFFACAGSEFVEKYVGVGAGRVRELFAQARQHPQGAVIFIDEIDAVGRQRSSDGQAGHREADQTLNELLSQLDGFTGRENLIVLGATNRLDVLDPALLRPGRLSRQIAVPLPAERGRLEILQLHAAGKPLADDVELAALAATTAGCSGADLEELLNEAAIMAARQRRDQLTQGDLLEGQLRALLGPARRDSQFDATERAVVAYHEAGHVLCAELGWEHDRTQRASIRPRGDAGGLALYGRSDRALHSPQLVWEQLVCLLGGRAAEWVTGATVSSGAANDLQQATALARQAVQELGFSSRAGQLSARGGRLSEQHRTLADQEVSRMVDSAYQEAVRLLEAHRPALERLQAALLEHQDLDRPALEAAMGPLEPQVCPVPGQLGPPVGRC